MFGRLDALVGWRRLDNRRLERNMALLALETVHNRVVDRATHLFPAG
jgi:hypothetical protein